MAKKSDFTVGISALKEELDKLTVAIRETQEEYNKTTEGLTKKEKKKYDQLRSDIKLMTDDLEKAKEKIKSFEETYNSLDNKNSKGSRDKIKSMVVEMGEITTNLKQHNMLAEMYKDTLNGTLEVVKEINENTNNNNNNNPSNEPSKSPNPNDWKEWNAEVAKAIAYVDKIRIETQGLTEQQKTDLGDLTEAIRSINKEAKAEFESERAVTRVYHDNIVACQAQAKAIEDVTKARERLNKDRDKEEKQLDNFVIKNQEIIASNEFLSQGLDVLKKQLKNVTSGDELKKWDDSFKLYTQNVKEFNKALKESEKEEKALAAESKALALAQASEIATLATAIRAKVINGLYNFALKEIRAIIDATAELDERLVEIRKVTDFSDSGLKEFVANIKEIGSATASTTSDLLQASAVFARSGYTQEQIEMLTEEAAVLRNVSDGITDMEKAAQVLISVMKAYNIPAENARDITDQLNNISNNAAISFDDLADGLSRVGSVFAAQNTSIGQLSAMLTGANEILQNVEKTSNGLKTISQRLRGIDAEMSGDVLGTAKLQDLFTTITSKYGEVVRITDKATGQLRGTYDILEDLAAVWDKMSSNEQQLLGEKIAGKNQITVLQALLNNWKSVENAIKNVDNATGSAEREQQAMLNSLTGAIRELQAAVQNMLQGAISSEFITSITKFLTFIVQVVDKIGLGNVVIGAGAGAIAGKIGLITEHLGRAYSSFSQIMGAIGETGLKIDGLNKIEEKIVGNLQSIALANKDRIAAADKIIGLSESEAAAMKNLIKLAAEGNLKYTDKIALSKMAAKAQDEEIRKLGAELTLEEAINTVRKIGLSLLVVAAGYAISAISKAIKKNNEAVAEATKAYKSAQSDVENIKSQIKSIYDEIDAAGGKTTQGQLDRIEELENKLVELEARAKEAALKLAEEINAKTVKWEMPDGTDFISYNDVANNVHLTTTQMAQYFDEAGNFIESKADEVRKYIADNNVDALRESREYLGENATQVLDTYEKLVGAYTDYLKKVEEEQEAIINQGITEDTFKEAVKSFYKLGDDLYDALGNFDFNKALENIDFEQAIALSEKFGVSLDDVIKRVNALNKTNIDKWQKEYSEIAAVERKLQNYVDLYNEATNGMNAKQLLTIIDNWSDYADILDVENGQLTLSKELIVAKAKASIESAKATLISQRDELEGDIAMAEAELSLRKAGNERGKGTVDAVNKVIKAKAYELGMNNALIKSEKGIEVSAAALAALQNSFAKYQQYTAMSTSELENAIANMKKRLADLNAQIKALENLNVEELLKKAAAAAKKGGKHTKAATKAVKELEDALKSLKEVLSELERQMSDTTDVYEKIQEAMKDIIDSEIEALENENDAIEDNMNYYRARLQLIIEAIEAEIEALEAEQEAAEDAYDAQIDALDEQIEALKKRTKEYEKENKAQQDALDEQIKALKEQQQAIDDVADAKEKELEMERLLLDIEKARLAAEKARDAYEATKRSKTVKTYDAERGWIWTANQKDVESAYNNYTSAQANYEKLLQDYADKLAEAERQAMKDALQEQIDALEAQKDALQELLEATKEAAEAEEESIEEAIAALEAEKDAVIASYEAQIAELQAQTDHLEGIEDAVDRAVDKYLNDQGVLDWVQAWLNASEEERAAMEDELAGMWQDDKEHQIANEEKIDELNEILQQIADMLKVTDEVLESEGVKDWLEAFANGDFAERQEMIKEMRDAYLEFYTHQQEEIKKIQDQIAKIEGSINYTNELLENWGTGEHYTPKNGYAQGGVVDSGLLTNTGMLSDRVKVHGTPTTPELILNGRQQANLLYQLAKQRPSVISKGTTNSSQSMYIATLNITADSQDTLHSLLIEAQQLASVS